MTYAPPGTSSFQRKDRSLNKSRLKEGFIMRLIEWEVANNSDNLP